MYYEFREGNAILEKAKEAIENKKDFRIGDFFGAEGFRFGQRITVGDGGRGRVRLGHGAFHKAGLGAEQEE